MFKKLKGWHAGLIFWSEEHFENRKWSINSIFEFSKTLYCGSWICLIKVWPGYNINYSRHHKDVYLTTNRLVGRKLLQPMISSIMFFVINWLHLSIYIRMLITQNCLNKWITRLIVVKKELEQWLPRIHPISTRLITIFQLYCNNLYLIEGNG